MIAQNSDDYVISKVWLDKHGGEGYTACWYNYLAEIGLVAGQNTLKFESLPKPSLSEGALTLTTTTAVQYLSLEVREDFSPIVYEMTVSHKTQCVFTVCAVRVAVVATMI